MKLEQFGKTFFCSSFDSSELSFLTGYHEVLSSLFCLKTIKCHLLKYEFQKNITKITYKHSQRLGSQFGGYFRQFSWHHCPIVEFLYPFFGIQSWLLTINWVLPYELLGSSTNTAWVAIRERQNI